jgi:hypothetical protein
MAKRCSADQWAVWVAEQCESALSVRDFCDWIGVSQNAIYLWPRKLALASSQKPGTSKSFPPVLASQAQCADFRSLFVPLTVLCSPVIEVDLPCGAMVRVPNNRSSLRRGLSVLIEAGSVKPRRVATDSKLAKKSLHARTTCLQSLPNRTK